MGKNLFLDFFRRHQNLSALCICALGICLNIAAFYLTLYLELPLYLDTIGTIIVASIGGYLPGLFVGFMTNIFKGFYDIASIYYGVLNVIIAVTATLIAGKNFKKYWHKLAISILSYSFIGGGVGALIPWFMQGLTFDSESLSGILYSTGIFNLFFAHLLASFLRDIPDKILAVLIAEIALNIIPETFYRYCSFCMWLQKPFSNEEFLTKDKTKVRVISVRLKTLITLLISFSIVALAETNISLYIYHKSIINDHKKLAMGTASLAAKIIDGDKVDEYIKTGVEAPGYAETKKFLTDILQSTPEISNLYVYKIDYRGFQVVFDMDTKAGPGEAPGTILAYVTGLTQYLPNLLNGEDIEPNITKDEYSYLLTAIKPVFNSRGDCVCYTIANVDVKVLKADEHSFLVEMISVFLGFFFVLCSCAILIMDFNIIYPIKSITNHVDKFEHAKDSQIMLDKFVKELNDINIHTGDEVEKLFKSLCRMTVTQAEQTRSIRKLSNETAKMQDGLIIIMADFVENRDSDTGAHVQKTAAYVKIIVEGLVKKGYYSEIITPKFRSDVVRSAPLHDVGKIKIPDYVLNKPGKLTEEEYDIMKTHTTAGKEIMESVISTVEGENYLEEARNMAAYHHERWDGNGYPENLKGEEIPLSARIMSVADVFDALTSPRVYKPAFSLEKSIEIILQGNGTQFDPKCVDAFLDSLDKVREVLKKYNPSILKS